MKGRVMSSISVEDLRIYLSDVPNDYEVIMKIKHKCDISKETGEKGWLAYINGIHVNDEYKEVYLMN